LSETEGAYRSLIAEREDTRGNSTSSEEEEEEEDIMEAVGPRAARLRTGAVEVDRIGKREHAGFVEAPEPTPPMGRPECPSLTP